MKVRPIFYEAKIGTFHLLKDTGVIIKKHLMNSYLNKAHAKLTKIDNFFISKRNNVGNKFERSAGLLFAQFLQTGVYEDQSPRAPDSRRTVHDAKVISFNFFLKFPDSQGMWVILASISGKSIGKILNCPIQGVVSIIPLPLAI